MSFLFFNKYYPLNLKNLYRSLMKMTGNKRYYSDLEKLFNRMSEEMELSAREKQALSYLSQDIQSSQNKSKNNFPMFLK